MANAKAEIGVFGGSGFYKFLDGVTYVDVQTPYGSASASVAIGDVGGRNVAFLPRHGARHEIPAHRVNYRANIWALRELGVKRIIGPSAAGSLHKEIEPGHIVILDQLVDRTSKRIDTYFDGPIPAHISLADPYCAELRATLNDACRSVGITTHKAGTVVVVDGPRFSTRAESSWYRSAGWHTVNMTQYPEVALARELGICYGGLALITDYDTGVIDDDSVAPVEMNDVFAMLEANAAKTKNMLLKAIPSIPFTQGCACASGGGPSTITEINP